MPIGEYGPYPERLRDQFDRVIWRFRTGAQWREMSGEFGPWPTVYGRFRVWKNAGVFTARKPQTSRNTPGKKGRRGGTERAERQKRTWACRQGVLVPRRPRPLAQTGVESNGTAAPAALLLAVGSLVLPLRSHGHPGSHRCHCPHARYCPDPRHPAHGHHHPRRRPARRLPQRKGRLADRLVLRLLRTADPLGTTAGRTDHRLLEAPPRPITCLRGPEWQEKTALCE